MVADMGQRAASYRSPLMRGEIPMQDIASTTWALVPFNSAYPPKGPRDSGLKRFAFDVNRKGIPKVLFV